MGFLNSELMGDIDPVMGMRSGNGVFGGLKDTSAEDAAKRENMGRQQEHQNRRTAALMQGQANMKKGGLVSSASKRGDGIAQRGKTRA